MGTAIPSNFATTAVAASLARAVSTATCIGFAVGLLATAPVAAASEPGAADRPPTRLREAPLTHQMELFLPDWAAPAGPIERSEQAFVDTSPLTAANRGQLYPLVPLPPALQSMATLAGCVLATRFYRRVRRQFRRR